MMSKIYVIVLLLASILEECFSSILPTDDVILTMHVLYLFCGIIGIVVYLFQRNIPKLLGSILLTSVVAISLFFLSAES